MMDDSLTAEMVGVLLDGVKDGGQPKIDALYRRCDNSFDTKVIGQLDEVLSYIDHDLAMYISDTPLLNPPHLLMLFAAVAYLRVGIPGGDLAADDFVPPRTEIADLDQVRENLLHLAAIIVSEDEATPPYDAFWRASKSSTQRIASRRIRFPMFIKALTTALV